MIKKVDLDTEGKTLTYNTSVVKEVLTDDYLLIFNPKNGHELLTGINGNPDPFALDYPSMLDVGIMGHCDNKCKFCYQGDKYEDNMSLEGFKRIVDQSKDFVNQIALGGRGDPNNHEWFEEIISYCVDNNIVPNYTTSGIRLTNNQIDASKIYCGAVAVSMYYKDHTWDALSRLMDKNVKTNIHYVVTKENMEEVYQLIQGVDMFDGKVNFDKLNAIVFLLFKPAGRGKDLDWSPTTRQLKIFAEMIKSPDCKFKIGMDSCLVNKVAQSRELTEKEELYADTCEAARMSCYITPDQKLVPCSFGNHDKYGIDISKGNLQEVWTNGQPFKDFREVLDQNKACCPYTVKGF